MATGKEIESRGHVVGFMEEIAKAADTSDDAFFTWFSSAKDTDAAFVRGSWDFMIHVALPAARFLRAPEECAALEIGHGGGRLLAAACRCFQHVTGIDVHEQNSRVEQELRQRGMHNFRLVKTAGDSLPVDDESIDVVYSFIVLQHVEKISVFETYLQETCRVLKSGGIAVLYFGRRYAVSHNRNSTLLYLIDRMAERFLLPRGYQELPARVNSTNLRVSLAYARSRAKRIGLDPLATLVSRKNVPDGITRFGGQNGLLLRKK